MNKSSKLILSLALSVFLLPFFSIQVSAAYASDLNGDGAVDVADYALFVSEFFRTGSNIKADLNKNGIVDLDDYSQFVRELKAYLANPGSSSSSNSSSSSVSTTSSSTGNAVNSAAMGKWTPNTKYDTCTKEIHDSYFVLGPDGKKYPTWHPPVHTNPNGSKCTFGHEHGRNPAEFQYWDEIRTHFAYDADKNGQISASELATSGIPFGYVNEQIDAYFAANTLPKEFMRHEDHVGHKIDFANGEGDIGEGTDPFDTSKTGGVVVPVKTASGSPKWAQSGIRCYHFHKVHQGVSTPDALTNNLHEAIMYQKCTSTYQAFAPSTSLISGMIAFGAPGEFTKFCNNDRDDVIKLGTTSANVNFPGTTSEGMRNIITRDCVEQTVLVPPGQFSSFPYEIWAGGLRIRNSAGKVLATNSGSWEVLDAIRYYNPNSANKISYTADWCYETLGNRKARGGTCDAMTNYGSIQGITFDDPRSRYRGLHRGQYILPHFLDNVGGATIMYSDPFGGNAQATPFPGAVKQYIAPVRATTQGLNSDPRIMLRNFDNGGNTVHAPN